MPPWPPRSTASIGPRRPESDVAGRPGAGPSGERRSALTAGAIGWAALVSMPVGFSEPVSPERPARDRAGGAGRRLRRRTSAHLRLAARSSPPRRGLFAPQVFAEPALAPPLSRMRAVLRRRTAPLGGE